MTCEKTMPMKLYMNVNLVFNMPPYIHNTLGQFRKCITICMNAIFNLFHLSGDSFLIDYLKNYLENTNCCINT